MDLNAAGMLRAKDLEDATEKATHVNEWRKASIFTTRERAALAYAEAMTLSDSDVDDALFAATREEFSEDELVELSAWICLENLYSKFNRAFRIKAQGFCTLPLAID